MERIKYLERQTLTAADLNDEQAYLLDIRRRHNLGNHDWGILYGLDFYREGDRRKLVQGGLVKQRDDLYRLFLRAGAAVDGYGRELYVPEPVLIAPELFMVPSLPRKTKDGKGRYRSSQSSARTIDLWLRYARLEDSPQQPGITVCGPGKNTRWHEEARLCVTRPPMDVEGNLIVIDPRRPNAVSPDDLDYPPFQPPPDDPSRPWPVYLGRLTWITGEAYPTVDDQARLPYAVLTGALLHSASRQPIPEDPQAPSPEPLPPVERAQVELAPVLSGRPPFAIRVPNKQGQLVQPAAVLRSGQISLKAHTTVVSLLSPLERERMKPSAAEKGKRRYRSSLLSTLYMGRTSIRFTQSMIVDPSGLAAMLLAGRLPLRSQMQREVENSLGEIFPAPPEKADTPQKRKRIRQKLANLLNKLVNQEPLADPVRLQNLRLSQATWDLIRSAPVGGDFRPLNARLIAELLSSALSATEMLGLGRAIEVGPLGIPETKTAMPWQLYRLEREDENGQTSAELRFETFDPGDKGDPTLYQFAVGKTDREYGSFLPCLEVDAACNVIIHGTLVVEGELIQGPVQADPNDPRFVNQLVNGWNQGNSAATSLSAAISSINASGSIQDWSYKLTIKNLSTEIIQNVGITDTYSIGGILTQTPLINQLAQLNPGATQDITISHRNNLQTGLTIYIAASVQGRLPTGVIAYASAQGTGVVT